MSKKATAQKKWLLLAFAAIVTVLVVVVLVFSIPVRVDTVTSPDGKDQATVYRHRNDHYSVEYLNGAQEFNVSGVREYIGVYFSAGSRYHLFVYEDITGQQRYSFFDYQEKRWGGADPEIACKISPDFAEELTRIGAWNSIDFRFQRWHETEEVALLSYCYTTADGETVCGEIWYNIGENIVKKN